MSTCTPCPCRPRGCHAAAQCFLTRREARSVSTCTPCPCRPRSCHATARCAPRRALTCREDLARHRLQEARARDLRGVHVLCQHRAVAGGAACHGAVAQQEAEGLAPEQGVSLGQGLPRGHKKVLCTRMAVMHAQAHVGRCIEAEGFWAWTPKAGVEGHGVCAGLAECMVCWCREQL